MRSIPSTPSLQAAADAMVDGRTKKTAYMVAVAIQVILTGLFIVSKAAFDRGLSTYVYVYVFYRLAAATALLLPISFINSACRRRTTTEPEPAMSCQLLFKLFLYTLLGNTFSVNVFNMSLKHTSAATGSAITNSMPVITFLLALLMGSETLKLRARSGMGKLAGIMFCLAGVLVIAFYSGPYVRPLADHPVFGAHSGSKPHVNNGVWIKGTFLLLLSCAAMCLWIVLQVPLLKEYPNKLVATTMQCLFGAIQSFVVAVVAERDFNKWKLGLDIGLLAILYSAFLGTCAFMYLVAWCAEMEGPVFVAMWYPLNLVLSIFCSFFFLGEAIYLRSILGGILLVAGLYSVLWNKSKEKEKKAIPAASTVLEKHEEELELQVL